MSGVEGRSEVEGRKEISVTYEHESRALDAEILGVIEAWHRRGEPLDDAGFDDLALRLFAYQLRYNAPYARYCARLGVAAPPRLVGRHPRGPGRRRSKRPRCPRSIRVSAGA